MRGLGTLRGSNLAGPVSAMVPVDGSGAGCGGSGRSEGCLPFLSLEGLSGVSGMTVPGRDWSLECPLVGVLLPKTPRILGACHVLVEGCSGQHSVSEVC